MIKIPCNFNGKKIMCRVTENMGYQGGDYVRAVEHNGEEIIVVKRGKIWRPKTISEKFVVGGVYCGQ